MSAQDLRDRLLVRQYELDRRRKPKHPRSSYMDRLKLRGWFEKLNKPRRKAVI
jgi:hypothetical protein